MRKKKPSNSSQECIHNFALNFVREFPSVCLLPFHDDLNFLSFLLLPTRRIPKVIRSGWKASLQCLPKASPATFWIRKEWMECLTMPRNVPSTITTSARKKRDFVVRPLFHWPRILMGVRWNVTVRWKEVWIIPVPKLVVNASARKTSWAVSAPCANLAFSATQSAKNVIAHPRLRVTKKQVRNNLAHTHKV